MHFIEQIWNLLLKYFFLPSTLPHVLTLVVFAVTAGLWSSLKHIHSSPNSGPSGRNYVLQNPEKLVLYSTSKCLGLNLRKHKGLPLDSAEEVPSLAEQSVHAALLVKGSTKTICCQFSQTLILLWLREVRSWLGWKPFLGRYAIKSKINKCSY